jgi:hypothetical protein
MLSMKSGVEPAALSRNCPAGVLVRRNALAAAAGPARAIYAGCQPALDVGSSMAPVNYPAMPNLLAEAIASDDSDRAAKLIRGASASRAMMW